jgi:hypothetical protein
MTLLSADVYFNRKVKVGSNVKELHFCTCVWFGTLEIPSKALILSKSLNNVSLASNYEGLCIHTACYNYYFLNFIMMYNN